MKNILSGITLIVITFLGFNWWDDVVGSKSLVEEQSSLFIYIAPYALTLIIAIIGLTLIKNGIEQTRKNDTDVGKTA